MRKRAIALTIVAFTLWGGATARADDELQQYLEQAAVAEFHATGIVMSSWGTESVAAMYEITRSHGMSMVRGPAGDLMVVDGLTAVGSAEGWYAVEVGEAADWVLADRYTLGAPMPTTRLGRPASELMVFEDGTPRLRLIVDDASRVPLLTEVLDGDGRVFRVATLIDFAPEQPAAPARPQSYGSHHMVMPMAEYSGLPGILAGYRLTDTYGDPNGIVQGYYSDGLFSFSVFESKRGGTPGAFADAAAFTVDGSAYRRLVTPSYAWVQWHAPDRSYVLVGDLPPDHLAAVLVELPRPGDRGLFVRLWRRLFG
ncbi:MAG: hypothetical protein A2Z12_04130 [Actinobacteria bacterium RBG_16_68_21]|nr:MAG: hypothetical protein A2Z12_04130 [Actinobacteria bacterium RBG_16_68_21]